MTTYNLLQCKRAEVRLNVLAKLLEILQFTDKENQLRVKHGANLNKLYYVLCNIYLCAVQL